MFTCQQMKAISESQIHNFIKYCSFEPDENPYFFLEGDLYIANSFLNSLTLLFSSSFHSDISIITCSLAWEILSKLRILTVSVTI